MHDVVLDPKTVHETPLSAHLWEDSDFRTAEDDEEDEASMRAQALEEARSKARKKAELDRWAEAEANRLAAIGARQREAERQADRQREQEERAEATAPQDASPAPTATTPRRRPPANVNMDEVRRKVSAQIRKELPAIAAAQSSGERSRRENGNSSG